MGEAARRRQQADLISVLIPERGRPEMLDRLICSLLDTAGHDEGIEILVAIDDDDPAWAGRTPFEHSRTTYYRWPRPMTLGEKLNKLAGEARGGIDWFIANDMVMETPGWPAKFRAAVAALPNRIGVTFPHDDLHPGHAAYPLITRQMRDAVGFFMPPCYPYWWIDTHWDQIGILLGQHREIDVRVSAPDGRGQTHGLIDLPFWVDFFHALAPIRLREATQLAAAAYGEATQQFTDFMASIQARQQVCATRTAHLSSPAFIARWADNAASPPSPAYPEVKVHAERMLAELRKAAPRRLLIALATPSGRTYEATTANCIASLAAQSARAGIDVFLCNVQTSMISHARNATVRLAMDAGCDKILWIDSDMKFEPNVLTNLLKHDKAIVGATYNRRTPPYTTLGRFKGARPEHDMRGGLAEAEALPGGLLLVDMSVYRALPWPWYFESYRWDGDDGLVAFKTMLRDYFRTVPPEDALAELDGTKLGVWLRTGFEVGLDPGSADRLHSEDLALCRKATRAGFQIWCCLDTTFSTAHIGVREVTCDRPPEVLGMAEAAE